MSAYTERRKLKLKHNRYLLAKHTYIETANAGYKITTQGDSCSTTLKLNMKKKVWIAWLFVSEKVPGNYETGSQ